MEPTNLPAKRLNETSGEDKPQIFRTLRNIDLNLLTIFEAVYVHKGIVNAAKILNLTPSAISQSIQKLRAIFPDPLFMVLRGILGKWKLTDRVLVNWLSPNTPPPSPCC
ncbi:LysR family transcriptional regulator, partial [Enterobacter hormaechei subsp. xiangfangensis]